MKRDLATMLRTPLGDLHRKRVVSKAAKEHTADTGEAMTSDEFCTPPDISQALFNFFGGPVGVDPCSNPRSIVAAHLPFYDGGLIRPWCRPRLLGRDEDTAYSNWPYSTNEPWAAKAIREMKIHNVRELVVLCMTSSSTVWFSNLMKLPKRNPRVICTARLRFLGPDGHITKDTCRFDPALIYYGPRLKQFDREFMRFARWSTWGR